MSSNISESRSARPVLRVCLYTPIPRAREFKPHPRSRLSLAKRNLIRSAYRYAWRSLCTTSVDIGHWIDHEYTNRGDIAIRDTVAERLRSLFPDHAVEFTEIAWGDLSDETIERINQHAISS